jgi:phage antirepressor YoqD-like protein
VTSVDDAKCSGHPSMHNTDENVDRVQELVHENRRITVREVAKMLGISYESVQIVLKDNLYMCRIAAKFMPCLLSEEQKENHVTTCQDL